MTSLSAANHARGQQARTAVRQCLDALPDVEVVEHPDDPGLLVAVDAGGRGRRRAGLVGGARAARRAAAQLRP